MKYTIVVDHEGREEYIPLQSRNQRQAMTAMRNYVHRNPDTVAFLEFFRASDGQRGYINPDGNASPTGHKW